MDYSMLSFEEIYPLLSEKEKVVVDFFGSYPNIDRGSLAKIGITHVDEKDLVEDPNTAWQKILQGQMKFEKKQMLTSDFREKYKTNKEEFIRKGNNLILNYEKQILSIIRDACFHYDKHKLDQTRRHYSTETYTVYENEPRIIWNAQLVDALIKFGFMDRDDWDYDRIERISYAMSLEDYIDKDRNFFPAFNRIIQRYVFEEKGFVNNDVGRRFEIRSDIPEEQKKIDEHFEKLASLEPLCRKFVEEYKRLKKETIKQLEVGRDLEKNLSRYSRLEFPLTSAVLYNKNVFAYALIKQGKAKCNLDRVCPFLLNGEIEDIKMIKELIPLRDKNYRSIAKQEPYEVYYRQTVDKKAINDRRNMALTFLKRIAEEPENKDVLLDVYYRLKKINYADINWYTNVKMAGFFGYSKFGKAKINPGQHIGPAKVSVLHDAIKNEQMHKFLPALFSFEDLDVNVFNKRSTTLGDCTYYEWEQLENHNKENNNTPIMQVFRLSEVYGKEWADRWTNEILKKKPKLNYANGNGETVLMTAIHHDYAYGVKVCEKLIYPEVLKDMRKFKIPGKCLWLILDKEVIDVLTEKYPDMQDSLGFTYNEFKENQQVFKQEEEEWKRVFGKRAKDLGLVKYDGAMVDEDEDIFDYDSLSDAPADYDYDTDLPF